MEFIGAEIFRRVAFFKSKDFIIITQTSPGWVKIHNIIVIHFWGGGNVDWYIIRIKPSDVAVGWGLKRNMEFIPLFNKRNPERAEAWKVVFWKQRAKVRRGTVSDWRIPSINKIQKLWMDPHREARFFLFVALKVVEPGHLKGITEIFKITQPETELEAGNE